MKIILNHKFENLISIENLLLAWQEFVKGKRNKKDVQISNFLQNELKLNLHPDKVFIKTLNSGVDFLGWINFSDHRILRTKTKKRMVARIKKNSSVEMLNSYLGLIKHGNTKIIQYKIFNCIHS